MLREIKTVSLYSTSKYGRVPDAGYVHVNFQGKNINDGCYVNELRYNYGSSFNLTSAEIESLEDLARNLYYNEPNYNCYEIDLVTKKLSKYTVEMS
ncbi:hypothetical protein CACET_c27480 [Clostridium aceticum]|uniref:Uncharacterized protein n=1 Tax=Clostridium aceticum TaxID=84022 RepID=A0A0D8I8I9_9CLOT|nr:hypothetical protein [Clostridium aceticum]AKL96193.1 hypothetical protein CACET_c27480 [Clostridium aceticum]KJF26610.1 hypothetical protein TZ02_12105 [Clostridium aceticum]